MSVKTITTIEIGGEPVRRLNNDLRRRRRVRAKIEWLLALDPSEPPIYSHATVYEAWHPTMIAQEWVRTVFAARPIYEAGYAVFLLPDDRSPAEVARLVRGRASAARDYRPALEPVVFAAQRRAQFPKTAIFTVVKSLTVSCGDAEFDAAPAWRAMPR